MLEYRASARNGRQTIASQISALRTWAQQQGHELREEHIYTDSAISGSRLDRPGLDQLRDAAAAVAFDVVAIISPDRLARRHAYQVLLLEEFRRVGCTVVFLERPISDDPHDQLLLEIQGAIAEYERAVLGERFRRGRLHKARAGIYLSHVAPYGYRYLPKGDAASGQLVINDEEAAMVRLLYSWLIEEQMTIRQMMKRLNAGPWVPRSGKRPWSASVVHHILSDPVYTGMAYANRFRFSPPQKPRHPQPLGGAAPTCRHRKPREEWIPIPVPAVIDEETAARAQAQLARNARLSWRHTPKYSYLLRCLLTCGVCGLAMFGVCYKATATQPERRYYKCHGKDPVMSAREHRCPRRIVKAEDLDEAVWQHVVQLLSDPAALLAQFAQYTQFAQEGDLPAQAAGTSLGHRG
jgi:site-specific DNA recombinase